MLNYQRVVYNSQELNITKFLNLGHWVIKWDIKPLGYSGYIRVHIPNHWDVNQQTWEYQQNINCSVVSSHWHQVQTENALLVITVTNGLFVVLTCFNPSQTYESRGIRKPPNSSFCERDSFNTSVQQGKPQGKPELKHGPPEVLSCVKIYGISVKQTQILDDLRPELRQTYASSIIITYV